MPVHLKAHHILKELHSEELRMSIRDLYKRGHCETAEDSSAIHLELFANRTTTRKMKDGTGCYHDDWILFVSCMSGGITQIIFQKISRRKSEMLFAIEISIILELHTCRTTNERVNGRKCK